MEPKEHITIIEPPKSVWRFGLGEIWNYKELIIAFFKRDLSVRYSNTWAGWAWAILNPLINIAILSFVFGSIAKVDTNGVNTVLFTTISIVAWNFFASMVSDGSSALIGAIHLVQKVYFPRIVLVLSKLLLTLFDFGIMMCIVAIAMIYHKCAVGSFMMWLPLAIIHMILLCTSLSLVSAALSVRYKDFRYILPIAVRVGMYITPIAYTLLSVPEKYILLFKINPLVGLIEAYRFALLGIEPDIQAIYISIAVTVLLFLISLIYFNKMDDEIADII